MGAVYLDHNATTPLRDEVRERLCEWLETVEGNPSSLHEAGRRARHLLDEARERTAAALGVLEDEVLFTSGGTESNNLAVAGVLAAAGPEARLVTTAVEHSSVLEPARREARAGREVELVGVDPQGRPLPERLGTAALEGCGLVSIMAANNEVGALAPLARVGASLAELPPERRPAFHTDAVQALGRLPLDLAGWGVDLASFSAHKVGGPLGVGVLVRRGGRALEPLFRGGEQEGGLRPGTENVPAIAAASLAIELAVAEQEDFARRADGLTRTLWQELHTAFPQARLLGPPLADPPDDVENPAVYVRLPGTMNVLIEGVDGKVLVTRLDLEGLRVSAGSACASGSLEPSHVLLAMGLSREDARAGLRMSLGRATTLVEIRQAVEILRRTLGRARPSGAATRGL